METSTILYVCVGVFLAAYLSFLVYHQIKSRKVSSEKSGDTSTRILQLQAYERLTLLVDRIALPNLISRVSQSGVSSREMQLLLTRSIYLMGMEIDFQGGLNSRGFTFTNPNASKTCGCGTSFAV